MNKMLLILLRLVVIIISVEYHDDDINNSSKEISTTNEFNKEQKTEPKKLVEDNRTENGTKTQETTTGSN